MTRRDALMGGTTLGATLAFGLGLAKGEEGRMRQSGFSERGVESLHRAMAAHVSRGDLSGVVTLISRGEEVVADAIGTLDFGIAEPMRRDTPFRIASMTKPVTGAVTMMLVEDGTLALDQPVTDFLPELADRRVLRHLTSPLDDTLPARRPITVEDLLTLRMGTGAIMAPGDYPINAALAERGMAPGPWLPAHASADAWIEAFAELPLMRQPGAAWMYDTGLTVLGALLERAADRPLGELYAERLFAPLGMASTGFHVPPNEAERLPAQYWRDFRTGVVEVFDPRGPESRFARPPGFASAAGGLVSTVDDYHAFLGMILNRGIHRGRRLLSERSVAAMTTDHITPAQKAVSPFSPGFWDKRGWGYAVSVVHRHEPGDPRGFGWDGGYGTSAYWDPECGTIGILMTQRMMESPAAPPVFTDFWRQTYRALDS
ncbi:MAG: serine hydrolase domain-containing protein [Azospirillaceae bacterium]